MIPTRPTPTGKEIRVPKDMTLITKTDHRGVITYCNEAFTRISGYSEQEATGQKHSIIRHPDMPKAIFYLMWKTIKKRQNFTAILKNMAKNGDHYWVITDFRIEEDYSGSIKSYVAYRRAVPCEAIRNTIEPLYRELLDIEKTAGMESSYRYLENFLESKGEDYNEFIAELLHSCTFTMKIKGLFHKIIP